MITSNNKTSSMSNGPFDISIFQIESFASTYILLHVSSHLYVDLTSRLHKTRCLNKIRPATTRCMSSNRWCGPKHKSKREHRTVSVDQSNGSHHQPSCTTVHRASLTMIGCRFREKQIPVYVPCTFTILFSVSWKLPLLLCPVVVN